MNKILYLILVSLEDDILVRIILVVEFITMTTIDWKLIIELN